LLVESVQPDYSKWNSIKIGMAEAEARQILGKPIHEEEVPEKYRDDPAYPKRLFYGRITFDSPSVPASFEFYIYIQQGNVSVKGHPFGGELSRDGKPTVPELIYPRDRTKFDHAPRFVDLRWNLSSGKYPIEYLVEVETGQYELRAKDGFAERVYHKSEDQSTVLPYAAFAFGGKNPGRWRVKAKNELGESDWSEWRTFVFER
jgi:hypothetical protein